MCPIAVRKLDAVARRVLASLILVMSLLPLQGRAGATPSPGIGPGGGALVRDHASDGRVPAGAAPAGSAATAASRTSSRNWLEGVDVSNWQGSIDWNKVKGAGKSFAFLKASEGKNYVDPYYAQYRQGAAAAGIGIDAYHFARPDLHPAPAGARAEADHYVGVAKVGVGDVIPVLDLERGDSLSTNTLLDWTWAWLREVHRRTGLKPMIYSGPYRWSTKMKDTAAFAKAGYRLWLADWCSPSSSCPWVPGNDWGGKGWTFWQYTDCGHVRGISGCVDLDHFGGAGLRPVQIPLLTVTTNGIGSVKSTPGGIACGSDCSSVFDPGSTVALSPS